MMIEDLGDRVDFEMVDLPKDRSVRIKLLRQLLQLHRTSRHRSDPLNIEDFLKESLSDVFYEDLFVSDMFCDEKIITKVDAMKSSFAYVCDVHPDGSLHFDSPYMSIFDINNIQSHAFHLGTAQMKTHRFYHLQLI